MTEILRAEGLTKAYGGVYAVRDATFSVAAGEVLGFVGLNGAGKSTTINMLLGFQKPTTGTIELFGEHLTLQSAHKGHRRIGFAAGDMSLFDGMTGEQYLRFVAKTYGTSLKSQTFQDLKDLFSPQLTKKLSTLSRGNKQKIALIAAFMADPELVILDEPSSGLDPLMQQHFLDLVRTKAASGTTIFMSSHYLNEVADVCSRILLIKNGELVKDIPVSELERAAGKLVRVVTKQKVSAPKTAESVDQQETSEGFVLEFIYKDKALRLQEWIGTLPHLQDVSITDHSAQAAFEDLYKEEPQDV